MPQSDRQDRRAASRSLLAARSVHDPRLWIVMRLVLYQATRTTSPLCLAAAQHISDLSVSQQQRRIIRCVHSKLGLPRKTKPQENKETRVPTTMRVSLKEIGNKTIAIYSLLPARTLRPSAAAQQHVDCIFSPPQTPPLP
jgi:hypothetical protein